MQSLGGQNLNAVTRLISLPELLLALSLENVLQSNVQRGPQQAEHVTLYTAEEWESGSSG